MKESNKNLQELDSELSSTMQYSLVKMMRSNDPEVVKTAFVIIANSKKPGIMVNVNVGLLDRGCLSFQEFVRLNARISKLSLDIEQLPGYKFEKSDIEYYEILERLKKY